MDNYAAGGIGASVIVFAGIFYKFLNHKRIRSQCCGRIWTASVDIEETTPKIEKEKSTQAEDKNANESISKDESN
jgi:hypothetical protein